MIIELHLLQSFPVSNLNRDDVGSPKTVRFGGVTRARVSSQSLKRAARELFVKNGLDEADLGVRTKRLPERAGEALSRRRDCDAALAQRVAAVALESLGIGVDETRNMSKYLLFVGKTAVNRLVQHCDEHWEDLAEVVVKRDEEREARAKATREKKQRKPKKIDAPKAPRGVDTDVFRASKTADVALFGRMIADNKDFTVDSASQVAHALSTHAAVNEFDYYTALDDLKKDDEPGADMIGTVDFNAACYYRYANLDLATLGKNLEGDEELLSRSVKAWLSSFIHAVPGGKQNSMAARTVPDVLLGVVRTGGAWGLANAFLNPVGGNPDLMGQSADAMNRYYEDIQSFYGAQEIEHVAYASVGGTLRNVSGPDGATPADTVDEFVAGLMSAAGAAH